MTILVKKSHFSFFASKEEKFTSLKVVIIIHCFGLIDTLVILELTFRRSSFKRRPDIHSRLTFLRNLIFDIWLKNMHKTYIGFHISCSFTHTQTKAATASLTREKGQYQRIDVITIKVFFSDTTTRMTHRWAVGSCSI